MRSEEIKRLTESTSDAAFAVDGEGLIISWNHAAENLFALPASAVMGRPCADIVRGLDECGAVCSQECIVRQAVAKRHPISNFDLLVNTANGKLWCNVSVLVAENGVATNPCAIHIVRPIDLQKRLEFLVRDFVVSKTNVATETAVAMISVTRSAVSDAELTNRELEILRLLGKGNRTSAVAQQLHISRATVNNHIQHILRKLDSHTRLEAIRRAEHAGLLC